MGTYQTVSGGTIYGGRTLANVWIMAGQSNSSGRVPNAQAPSDTDPVTGVNTWKRTTHTTGVGAWEELDHSNNQYDLLSEFGAELTLMKNAMAEYSAPHLIKLADGGTSLATDWAPASALRTSLITDHIDDALTDLASNYDVVKIHGFYWDQGEQDGILLADSNNYQTNLSNFVSAVRTATVADLPFVARRMYSGISGPGGTYISNVISAQDAYDATDSNFYLTNETFDDIGDGIHLSAAGQNNQANVVYDQLKSLNAGQGLTWQA